MVEYNIKKVKKHLLKLSNKKVELKINECVVCGRKLTDINKNEKYYKI